jgi:hypothetical protein
MLALKALDGSTLCPVVHGTNIAGARAKTLRRFIVTSTWRDSLTMMMATCCGAAVIGLANQPGGWAVWFLSRCGWACAPSGPHPTGETSARKPRKRTL